MSQLICFVKGVKVCGIGCFVQGAKCVYDVLSRAAKMAWDVLSRV